MSELKTIAALKIEASKNSDICFAGSKGWNAAVKLVAVSNPISGLKPTDKVQLHPGARVIHVLRKMKRDGKVVSVSQVLTDLIVNEKPQGAVYVNLGLKRVPNLKAGKVNTCTLEVFDGNTWISGFKTAK